MNREIRVIEELSEVEPDCKCKHSPHKTSRFSNLQLYSGCIESLVHYKRLLLEKHLRHETDNAGKLKEILSECLSALSNLERIDPYRIRRYQEIGGRF